ncbi:MAG: autotransporter domain-containing protein [Akkermansia muciniphila]
MKLHLPMTLLAALLASFSFSPSATAAELTWAGTTGNNVWTLNGTPDDSPWADNAVYTDTDTVIFGTVDGQDLLEVIISGTVTPAGLTFNSDTTSYVLKGDGALGGNGVLNKSGTSTLRLETLNSNFSGNINLNGGILELGADGVLGTGKLNWGGGTIKYGEGVTTDISGNMNSAATGKDTIHVDTNGNDVTWSDFARTKYAYIKDGLGTLTLSFTAGDFNKAITINEGCLAFDTSKSAINYTGAKISGGGELRKTGSKDMVINNSTSLADDFTGLLNIVQGIVKLNQTVNSATNLNFNFNVNIAEGGTLFMNGGGNAVYQFNKLICLANGSTIQFQNAKNDSKAYILKGGVQVGTDSEDVTDWIVGWGRTISIEDQGLSGSGTLQFLVLGGDSDIGGSSNRLLRISASGENFTGTLNLGSATSTSDRTTVGRTVELAHQDALKNATVNLLLANSVLSVNNADNVANIAGLNGEGTISGTVNGEGASGTTLNLVQKDALNTFTGTIDSTVNLVKSGAGSFIFAGTNNGRITSSEGMLQLGNAAGDYSAGNINLAGGSLNLGGSGNISNVSFSSLAFGADVNIFMDIMGAEHDQLTYTGTAAVELNGLSFTIDLAASTENSYTLFTTATGSFINNGALRFLGLNRGATADISLSGDGKSIILNVTNKGENGNLVWNGAGVGLWMTGGDPGADSPWSITGSQDNQFYTGDHVTFDGTAAADKRQITISGNVSPGSVMVTADGYVFGGSGSITGSGKLTMNADGTLRINTANAYTGGTELLQGSIAVNNSEALGTGKVTMAAGTGLILGDSSILANDISMTGSGTFTVSGEGATTLNGILSDTADGSAGKLVKAGDGTLVIGNAANTYTGGTQITEGTLSFNYGTRTGLGTGGIEVEENGTLLYAITTNAGKDASLFTNTVTGAGTIILNNTGQDETNINNAIFAGFGGNLVLRGNLRFAGGAGNNLRAVKTITVETGTHLFMNGGTWAQDFTIAGTGTATSNDKLGALRMDGSTISGNVTLSANANIVVYNNGTSFITGNLIGGNNELTFRTNGNAAQKLQLSGASVAARGIKSVQAGTLILGGGTGDGNKNTVAELGAGGLNLNANTVLELNNVTIRATEQWAQNVASNTVTLKAGTTNTIDTNGTDITFNGNMGGAGSLVKDGDGTLSIGAGSNYSGETTVNGGLLNMNGAALTGNIFLGYGSLAGAQNATGNVSIRQDTPGREPATVSMGGMSGSKLVSYHGSASRTGDQATRVTDIGAGHISLSNSTLGISSDMIGGGSGEIFSFSNAADGSVTLSGTLMLQLTDEAAAALLANLNNTLIHITNGTLNLEEGTTVDFDTPYNIFDSIFGSGVTSRGGSLVLLPKDGAPDSGWLVQNASDSPLTLADTDKDVVEALAGIHNNGVININMTGTQDLQLNNLEGALSSAMINTGANTGLTLVLANTGDITSSTYKGSIEGDAAIRKEGAGYTMNIGGNVRTSRLDVAEGTLNIGGKLTTAHAVIAQDAALGLTGKDSSIDALDVNGALTLGENASATAGSLTTGAGSSIGLGENSELSILSSTALGAAVTGAGTFTVSGTGSVFSLAAGGSISDDTTLALRDGASTTVDGALSVGGLAGDGTVNLNGGALDLHNASSVFSGDFQGAGTVRMNGTGSQTLEGSGSADVNLDILKGTLVLKGGGMAYGQVSAGNGGILSLVSDTGMPHLTANGDFTMNSGSTLNIYMNAGSTSDLSTAVSSTGTVSVGDASINLYNASTSFNAEDRSLDLVLIEGADGTEATLGSGYKLSAGFLSLLYNLRLEAQGSNIVLLGEERTENPYLDASNTHNSTSGGTMLNDAKWLIAEDQTSNLYLISDSIARDMENGDMASASRKLAAAAGSTVNALGTAQKDALRDQMGWIRNRTTLMGVNPAYVNEDLPYFHMWMEGTGSYAKLDTRGDESGYQLTTWGGTVGMDVDISDRFTMGAAFTANYGDLTAGAADTADGHLDSYYANLFGRYQSKRWAHTLILTGGWNDAKLNRTVNYGAGSYNTQGNTNGWGFGAMYELTYDVYLNEDRSSILQPLANVSVVTTRMDGYTETGAGNAGLNVGKQEWTTGTVALGGRWMGLIGSNIFGREALAEFRVNAAQDMGDRRGETNVALLGNPGFMQSVRGARVGTTALQIGAGLSVPMGTQGTVFVNGNADFRDGANSVNGSIGYRYDF